MSRKPIPYSDFARHIKKKKQTEHQEEWMAEYGAYICKSEAPGAARRRHFGCSLNHQRNDSQRRNGIAETDPVPREKIGRKKRRRKSAEAEEQVDEVQRDPAMCLAYIAHQRICACHHDAPADAEQEQDDQDAPVSSRARKGVKCNSDKSEAENKSDLLAFAIQQWTNRDRGDDEPQSLRKRDCSILG